MSDRERDGFATGMQAADDPAVFLTLDVATSTVIAGTPPSIDMEDKTTEGPAAQSFAAPGGATGDSTGRYAIIDEIDRGGMGAVLRGRDSGLNREVALKVLLDKHRDKPDILRRFFEEAQIGGQLQHPGIVPIYDLGTLPDSRPFFAMKLVKGRTLASMLAERSSPADDSSRFLSIFEQVAQTVAYAHSRQVIHRDLKPLNVMVGAFGEVQVMDWGVAKVLTPDASVETPWEPDEGPLVSVIDSGRERSSSAETSAGSRMGTPAYMSPEQARGEVDRIGKASDVFSLGAILCEILTGSPAYTGRTHAEVLRKSEFAELEDAGTRLDSSGADPDLIALARRCLSREPGDRPADASEVAAAIAAHLAAVQERLRAAEIARVEADARVLVERTKAEAGRARLRTTIAAAAALLVAMLIGGGWFLADQSRLAESDRIIGETFARAEALNAEAAGSGPDSLAAWQAATVAAERARDALSGRPARAELVRRVDAVVASTAGSLTRARDDSARKAADRLLVGRLDEARLMATAVKDGKFDPDPMLAAYAAAFREAGVPLGQRPASEVAARLANAEGVDRIAAALDGWAQFKVPPALKADMIAVAEGIDPTRNPLRRAIRTLDREALLALARGEDVRKLPPLSASLLAYKLVTAGLREEAIVVLTAARDCTPGDFWLNHDLATTLGYEERPRTEEIVRFRTAAVALRPASSAIHHNLGLALAAQRRWIEAETAFRDAIRLDPSYASAHNSLGLALKSQGRFGEAEAAFRKAIRLDPKDVLVINNLGGALEDQGRSAEAERTYREVIRLDPKDTTARYRLGYVLSVQKRPVESEAAFREAIRLNPNNPKGQNDFGVSLFDQDRLAEAEAAYREAIRLDPRHGAAHANLGVTLRGRGRPDEAAAAFRDAIAIEPDLERAHHELFLLLLDSGRLADHLGEFRDRARLHPDSAASRYYYGRALKFSGLLDGAVEESRAVVRLRPASGPFRQQLAWCYWTLRDWNQAVREYREAIRLGQDRNADVHNELGVALRNLGRWDEAAGEFKVARTLAAADSNHAAEIDRNLASIDRLRPLAEHLPAVLRGEDRPENAQQWLDYASFCLDRDLPSSSARFFGEAFRSDSSLIADRASNRYDAACAAALAGCGRGKDDPMPDEAAKTALRTKALGWLRDEHKAWAAFLEADPKKNRPDVARTLQYRKGDPDLFGVRDEKELAKLPEAERKEWLGLWADADKLLGKAVKP